MGSRVLFVTPIQASIEASHFGEDGGILAYLRLVTFMVSRPRLAGFMHVTSA